MKLFQKKKPSPKPASPWTPVDPDHVPLLEQSWVGVFSLRDEAYLWLRKGDIPDPPSILGIPDSSQVFLLVFPDQWKTRRLLPQLWPYYRFREGRVQTEGFVDPLIWKKTFKHSQENRRWDVTTPHTWRFLKFFFPFYAKTEENLIRSRLEGFYDTWTGDSQTQWLGSRGLALGLVGTPESSHVLDALGNLAGKQLCSTRYWSEPQSWKAVEPLYGAPGVTLEVLILLNGKHFQVKVYLTHNFITDASTRLVPSQVMQLNKHRVLGAVEQLLLIKEALSDPKILLTERTKIPLSLTLGELLPWFSPRDRRLFLETQVYGKYSVHEIKKFFYFIHQGEIYSDPGFAPGALIPYLGPTRIQEWASSGSVNPGTSRDLHELNRNLFFQACLRLKSDKSLLSPQGRELFDSLWTQTENTRHRALIQRFSQNIPGLDILGILTKQQIQRISTKWKDREWAYLLWSAPALEVPVKFWFTPRRWKRLKEEVLFLNREHLRGDLDLAMVWKVCRQWIGKLEAVSTGRGI